MQFDIRIPIGTLFVLLGTLLGLYGLSVGPVGASGAVDLNVNAWWGGAMALFGVGMLALAGRAMVLRELRAELGGWDHD